MTSAAEPTGPAAEPTGPAVNALPDPHAPDQSLGGRLPLLKPGDLDAVQTQARDGLVASRGADAQAAGFTMELPGGELIGPFNAYLHVPPIFRALRDWMAAIQEYGLPGDVQQVAILTVGAAWRSDYEGYAPPAEARTPARRSPRSRRRGHPGGRPAGRPVPGRRRGPPAGPGPGRRPRRRR